jgi:hypothetical protein
MELRRRDDGDQIGGIEDEVDLELCQLISTLGRSLARPGPESALVGCALLRVASSQVGGKSVNHDGRT